jgi:hypothetical protein
MAVMKYPPVLFGIAQYDVRYHAASLDIGYERSYMIVPNLSACKITNINEGMRGYMNLSTEITSASSHYSFRRIFLCPIDFCLMACYEANGISN